MVSNPVQNINYFLKHRPPLVIFLLCLVVMAVSTFYFAFKIESEDQTVNIDKKHDWLQLLKHFNNLKTCLLPMSEAKNEVKNYIPTENFSVFTEIEIDHTESLQKFSEVRGTLTLEDWDPTACSSNNMLQKHVEIYFQVPKGIKENTIKVCAIIKGPPQILPKFSEPNCLIQNDPLHSKVDTILTSFLTKDFDSGFCARGEVSKLSFSLEQNEILNFLDDDIRIRIYTHLIWCSYILVFFIFCIILYAILYKDENMKKEIGLRLL